MILATFSRVSVSNSWSGYLWIVLGTLPCFVPIATVWIFMSSFFAACAAGMGPIPVLLDPSVIRTMILDFVSLKLRSFNPDVLIAEPMAVPSSRSLLG